MTTGTLTQDNEALIQEMLRDAKVGEVPSELRTNPILHKGDETLPVPMMVREISSAGYVWVWDTRTFEKIPILYYMLPSKLRQRRQDGSFRFTTTDPKKLPQRGKIKCMLHPLGENRQHYDELGFRTCPKDNLINPHQMQQHMAKKHPQEWAAIKAEKAEIERQEDRALQKLLLENAIQTRQMAEDSTPDEAAPAGQEFSCSKCGQGFTYRKAYRKHEKDCKG